MNSTLKSRADSIRRPKAMIPVKVAAVRIRSGHPSSPMLWQLFRDVLSEIFLLVFSDGLWLYDIYSSLVDDPEDDFEI